MPSSSSNRLIGIDVAYAVAIFGCIVYCFFFVIGDKVQSSLSHTRFNIVVDCFPALFFFLNGFTVTLTMRDRRVSNRKLLSYLGKRGTVLFLVGLAFCYWWPMNIFMASGIMYMISPFITQWNNVILRIVALLAVIFGIALLNLDVPTYTTYNPPTLEGGQIYNLLGFVLFNGYFSVLPWIAFFLAGMLFGRTEVRPRGILPPASLMAIAMIIGSAFVNRYEKILDTDIVLLQRSDIFFLNYRLLFLSFVVYGIGMCILFINTVLYLFRNLQNKFILKYIQTISSMKYSLIFFHTLLGVITLNASNVVFFSSKLSLLIYVTVATSLSFYLTFVWKKKVSEQGPMEWLIKRISGSTKK